MSKTLTSLSALVLMLAFAKTALAEDVEIYLSDMLENNQSGYCLDIAGAKGARANPDDGLQGHTCYSPGGALGVDQTFETNKFAEGVLYMPEFDVCVQISSVDAGTSIDLAVCDSGDAQSFAFSGEGTITPASAPEMCFTVGEATRSGRGPTNQIKVLSLEPCAVDLAAYQTWAVRSSID
ncbi:RICIN domain-containing protein [Candidatus Halocynthiibacter alkanivorans]|uniref:RICIN domain-containing protein n=1 Tax=Candidatus Halocynthiibacter alkanivorans TaxID=2267619 RepID=UPI000DF370E8|nr:RICIN domain-containing protein [Candidatus Halocynthiibacter alkanivorans]